MNPSSPLISQDPATLYNLLIKSFDHGSWPGQVISFVLNQSGSAKRFVSSGLDPPFRPT